MIILLFIAVPSISLLYGLEEFSGAAALVIQVVGRQWYWVYEYPTFTAQPLELESLETEAELRDPRDQRYPRAGLRLLDSTPLLLPLALELEFLTASEDVIHGFALPSAGLKMDAVPGRLNQAISTFLRPGIFYGQCSELCGSGHGFMPITAQVVVEPLFQLGLLEKAELMGDYLTQWRPLLGWSAEEESMLLLECEEIRRDLRALVTHTLHNPDYLSQAVSPELRDLGRQQLAPLLSCLTQPDLYWLHSISSENYQLALDEHVRGTVRPVLAILDQGVEAQRALDPNFSLASAPGEAMSEEQIHRLLLREHRRYLEANPNSIDADHDADHDAN